ncbi:MAG: serine--tRNA ligase, partial [Candidatus Lokiarchaeia archaeon]|nr:serine--tRNA ligase [Candidatus Lokiarchaeia archaeon]
MLDIKLIRENPDKILKNLKRRNNTLYIEMYKKLIDKDAEWRSLKIKIDNLRNQRNKFTKEIQSLKKNNRKEEINNLISKAKKIPEIIKKLDIEKNKLESEIKYLLLTIPNTLDDTVPYGEDSNGNMVIEKWGEKPIFNFKPKSHVDLVNNLQLADIERAAKTSGTRFYFLKNHLVELEFALILHSINILKKNGFDLIIPPTLVRSFIMEGGGFLPTFREDVYKIEDEDLYLVGTSEAPLVGMHADEILYDKNLPLRYGGISTCFRTEAGAHGKDTKGIFRTHHFEKVEMVSFTNEDDSISEHDYLFKTAESFWQSLGLHYQKVNICTGDIGIVASKKYDLEAWYPSKSEYRELVSTSNCTDYQARRLNIRYRKKDGMPTKMCHTLNSTLIALERGLTCILENYQKEDGSVEIPKILQKYTNFKEIEIINNK